LISLPQVCKQVTWKTGLSHGFLHEFLNKIFRRICIGKGLIRSRQVQGFTNGFPAIPGFPYDDKIALQRSGQVTSWFLYYIALTEWNREVA
ncbi:MAG: hypothetical protein QNK38_03260, partial [Nitrospirota bacterium]|nr:hypothetical protein [Nitrospirota bacterium]